MKSSALVISIVLAVAAAAPTTGGEAELGGATLELTGADGRTWTLVPARTRVTAEIVGRVARTAIEQSFDNPSDLSASAVYLLPLPPGTIVDDMTVAVGDRELRGGLDSAEVLTRPIGVVDPGIRVTVRVHLVEPVPCVTGTCSWEVSLEAGAEHDVALDARLETPGPIGLLECPSHPATIRRLGDTAARIRLGADGASGGGTFLLRWTVPTETLARDRSGEVLDAAAPGAEVVEEVVVETREEVVDLDRGGTQTTRFSDEFIGDLPVLDRQYQSVLTRAPGVLDSDDDGNPNVHGARERDFKATIDGVSNVDPLTGTFMSDINPDAIAEIEVITSGAGAEFGGATGGFARVLTKTGGNDFEGVANFFYRTHELDGNGATGLPKDQFDFDRVQPSVSVTGPIVKNRLWFAASHEYFDQGNPVVLIDNTAVTEVREGWRHLDKITWQATARNRLSFTYSADPLEQGPLGVSNLTRVESGYGYTQGGPTYQLHWNVPYSPTASWEALVAFSDTGIGIEPTQLGVRNSCFAVDLTGRHAVQPMDLDQCLDGGTNITSGSYFQEFDDRRQRWTYQLKGEKFLQDFAGADHNFKAGVTIEDVYYDYDWNQTPSSFFEKGTTATLATGDVEQVGGSVSRTVWCAGGADEQGRCDGRQSRAADGIRWAAWIEDTLKPLPNLSIRAGVRYQREEYDSRGFEPFDPLEENRLHFETWDRCQEELAHLPKGPRKLKCTRRAMKVFTGYESDLNPARRQTIDSLRNKRVRETFTISDDSLSPRLSISWDPWNNGKTKLFGTWGRYHGEIFMLPLLAEQGPDRLLQEYDWVYREAIDRPVVAERPSRNSAFSVNQVDRDLRTPYNDEWTLGFEREIAPETALSVVYVNRHYRDQLQDIERNHEARDLGDRCVRFPDGHIEVRGQPDGKFDDCGGGHVALIGSDGLPIRDSLGGIIFIEVPDGRPDLYLQNPWFNQVFLIGNFNESEYEAVQVQLTRRFYRNWELDASYVWSEATGQAEDYNQGLGNDPSTIQDEVGPLGYDQRHLFKVNARTVVPWWGGFRLGASVRYETGLPYSLATRQITRDALSYFEGATYAYTQDRTFYDTGSRNDQRNEAFWTVDVNFQKEFTLGPTTWSTQLEVFNLLNDDRKVVDEVLNDSISAQRRFGRQYQIALKVAF